ncbi:MAG TPA: carboxypeptidase-like regulatory domain-containing protein [Planctomycetota bacterium]
MRRALVAVLALALVGLLWIARTPAPRSDGPVLAPAPAESPRPATLLSVPPAVEELPGTSGASGDARQVRAPGARKAAPVIPTGPVRGRLVVDDTGDPIEAVLGLRLRTIDLALNEELVTRPDGSFAGRVAFPRTRLLALVKDEQGRELIDHEAPFDPELREEWLVPLPYPTSASGRLVDRRGEPLEQASVALLGRRAELAFVEDVTDGDGRFLLEGLRAGPYRLLLQGPWSRSAQEITLRAGPNELGDLVLAEPDGADVLVELVLAEPGPWPDAWLELRTEGDERVRRFGTFDAEALGAGRYRLQLPGIPRRPHELAVHAFDGRRYEPARAVIEPPATLELRVQGALDPGTLFRARSAASGEALLGFGVFGRRGRTWGLHLARERTPLGAVFRMEPAAEVRLRPGFEGWVLFAGGHRAALGSFAGAGPVIEVVLEPGWCELLQFEDAEGDATTPAGQQGLQDPPVLAGVEVLADGVLAATSDAQGFCLVQGEREPATLEFRLPGWRVVTETRLAVLRTVVLARVE